MDISGLSAGYEIGDPVAVIAGVRRDGYAVVTGALAPAARAWLAGQCARILALWQSETPDHGTRTNMAWLTEPRYWAGDPDGLTAFLELVADPALVALLTELGCAPPLFNNTQLFPDPPSTETTGRSWYGLWHRDTQFLAPEDEAERAFIASLRGIHVHVALVADDNFEIVPGSHLRFDTPAERAIRKAELTAARSLGRMPGAARIGLAPGDAVIFDAATIHRGRYAAGTPRLTFDIIYQHGPPLTDAHPPPTCFADLAVLARLSPGARAVFARFVEAYGEMWAGA